MLIKFINTRMRGGGYGPSVSFGASNYAISVNGKMADISGIEQCKTADLYYDKTEKIVGIGLRVDENGAFNIKCCGTYMIFATKFFKELELDQYLGQRFSAEFDEKLRMIKVKII